jgi:hypothetical protein
MAEYKYKQHPHVATRKHPAEKGRSIGVNERIGLWVTKRVGTMWAAYVFFGLTLVSLPAAISSGSVIIMVSWIAQTFLQLVLLPIIIVGQNIQAASSEQRAIATYEDAGAILEEAKEIQVHLQQQDKALSTLVNKVKVLEAQLEGQIAKKPKKK